MTDQARSRIDASPAYWRSLAYFNVYRVVVGGLFVLSVSRELLFLQLDFGVQNVPLFTRAAYLYLILCAASLLLMWRVRRRFDVQLGAQVIVDICLFLVMMFASGAGHSGIGVLLLVSLAAAGLVGEGRMVLLYAALAAIGVIGLQLAQTLHAELDPPAFLRLGVLSLAYFATALLARMLARRVVASDELARRRGEDLRRQLRLTNRVIAMLEAGVLVVAPNGDIQQANPKARELLRLDTDEPGNLAAIGDDLAAAFAEWRQGGTADRLDFSPPARRQLALHAHLVEVPEASGDALVFLQDVGEAREHARRMKLAALGRLTAGIAHEIRNPLSSIRHATELLREDCADPATRRMFDIVLDNAERLERIVRDVLELGRRDGAVSQNLSPEAFFAAFLNEFLATAGWSADRVALDIRDPSGLRFDPSHLRQILWNLLSNAGRYASGRAGSIRITVARPPSRVVVEDDGPGVPHDELGKLFEPFHTTSQQGNGLGLYIARELCEANGYRLIYAEGTPGACFTILGGE